MQKSSQSFNSCHLAQLAKVFAEQRRSRERARVGKAARIYCWCNSRAGQESKLSREHLFDIISNIALYIIAAGWCNFCYLYFLAPDAVFAAALFIMCYNMSAIPFSVFLVWKKALNKVVVFLKESARTAAAEREKRPRRFHGLLQVVNKTIHPCSFNKQRTCVWRNPFQ